MSRNRVTVTAGMANAMMRGKSPVKLCQKCGRGIPKYGGRYPAKCPGCGGRLKDVRGETSRGSVCESRIPRIQALLDVAQGGVIPMAAVEEVFPGGMSAFRMFLEERGGTYFRVESPYEPVLLFEEDGDGLRFTWSDAPEGALGFDPRADLVEDGGWDRDGWADLDERTGTVTLKFPEWGSAEDFAEVLDRTDFPYYMDDDEPLVTVEYSGAREREQIQMMADDFRVPVLTETSAGTVQGRVGPDAPEAFMEDLRSWVNEYALKGALIQGTPLPCGNTGLVVPVHTPAQEKLRAIGERHGVEVEIGTYDQNTGIMWRPLGEAKTTDTGRRGKAYETAFKLACMTLGMKFEESGVTGVEGAVWDIRPVQDGTPWMRLLHDEDVNLKVNTARFLLASREIYKAFRNIAERFKAGRLTKELADARAERAVRAYFNRTEVAKTLFMKPKDKGVEQGIIDAARARDVKALDKLMVSDNFSTKMLGEPYTVEMHIDWSAPDNPDFAKNDKPAWQRGQMLHITGHRQKKLRMGGEHKYSGGINIVQFRTSKVAKPPFHRVKDKPEPVLTERSRRKVLDRPPEPGDGPTRAHGSYRFEIRKRKKRKPRKDIEMSLQNQRNAKRGQAQRIAKAKEWHRSREGRKMHSDLGRYNRGPMTEASADDIWDKGTRLSRDTMNQRASLWLYNGKVWHWNGRSFINWGEPKKFLKMRYRPSQFPEVKPDDLTESSDIRTMDDAFDDILRKLIAIDSVDVLQDVEFSDDGAIYLFIDPSLTRPELDEVMAAVGQANPNAQLVGNPADPSADWWVIFAPYSQGEGGALAPNPEVWSVTPDPVPGAPAPQTMVKPAITSVDQIATTLDVEKLVKSVKSVGECVMMWSSPEERLPTFRGVVGGSPALLESLTEAAGRDEGTLFLVRADSADAARGMIETRLARATPNRGVYEVL